MAVIVHGEALGKKLNVRFGEMSTYEAAVRETEEGIRKTSLLEGMQTLYVEVSEIRLMDVGGSELCVEP